MSAERPAIDTAAIQGAATAAYAIDAEAVASLVPPDSRLAPADAVAAVRTMYPGLFGPKHARDMSEAEYKAAYKKLTGRTGPMTLGLPPRK